MYPKIHHVTFILMVAMFEEQHEEEFMQESTHGCYHRDNWIKKWISLDINDISVKYWHRLNQTLMNNG